MLKKLYPNTLLKKCIYMICVCTAALFALTSGLIYQQASSFLMLRIRHNLSVVTGASAVKISYLLHQNTQYLLKYAMNESLMSQCVHYVESEKESGTEKVRREEIAEELLPETVGQTQPGAIVANRNMILVTEGEIFCQPEMEPYAEAIVESPWFAKLPELMENTKIASSQLPRVYLPVFEADQERGINEFLVLAAWKEWMGHTFWLFMAEDFDDYRFLLQDLEGSDVSDYVIVGSGEQILFQNMTDSYFAAQTTEELADLFVDDQYTVKLTEQESRTVIGTRLSYQAEELKMALCIGNRELMDPYLFFIHLFTSSLSVFTVVLVAMIYLILRKSLGKLHLLAEQMQGIDRNNYRVPRKITGKDEIGMLAATFYQMMDQIQDNMEKIRHQEQKEKKIEYSLMISQIDPHFIYNTLNTITYLAELNQTKDIMIINQALISMLRDRLKMTRLQIFDTVENEKQQLLSYITIQQYLCSNTLSFTFEAPQECMSLRYPKNILQPLVENAILHGILLHRDKQKHLIPGRIRVAIYTEKGMLCTQVEDNGVGMEQQDIEKYFSDMPDVGPEDMEDKSEHIGIYNIRMRLKYLYGEQFSMQVRQATEGGLVVSFCFPICNISPDIEKSPENI